MRERATSRVRRVGLWLMALSTGLLALLFLLVGAVVLIETVLSPGVHVSSTQTVNATLLLAAVLSFVVGLAAHACAVIVVVVWLGAGQRGGLSSGERLVRGGSIVWLVLWSGLWALVGSLVAMGFLMAAVTFGRPMRLMGLAARVPPRLLGWRRARSAAGQVDRVVAGIAWTHTAMVEHASAPVFDGLALDLVAVGAPDGLVRRARRAAADERDHARRAYAVVEHLIGVRLAPGREPRVPVVVEPDAARLRRVARQAWRDGVVGEGVAAMVAQGLAEQAEDALIERHLRAIAVEERQHAELSADVLAWCEGQGVEVSRVWPEPGHEARNERLAGLGVADAYTLRRALIAVSTTSANAGVG